MTLQDFANLSTGISAVIALIAFLASRWDSFARDKAEEIRKWQSVLVYSILDKYGELTFDEIKSHYLQNAQQNMSINIPKKEIQDAALLRVLLGLKENGVIFYTSEGTYCLDLAFPDNRNELSETMLAMLNKKEEMNEILFTLRALIYDTVENSESKFNPDSLYRHLTEKEKLNISHSHFLTILISMERQGSIARNKDGSLVAMKRVLKTASPNK